MTKIKIYDTVVLLEPIDGYGEGEKGAVVEVYTTPYEAYDIEIVTDEGKTRGLLEAVQPYQIAIPTARRASLPIRFKLIRVEENGKRAAVLFSNGREIAVKPEELYALAG